MANGMNISSFGSALSEIMHGTKPEIPPLPLVNVVLLKNNMQTNKVTYNQFDAWNGQNDQRFKH